MSSAVPTPPNTPHTAYQGNSKVASNKAAEEPKDESPRVKKIEGVNIVKVKKPLGRRIAETFGGEDLKTVGKVLLLTVVVPSAKDLLMEVIDVGGRRMIYGDTARRPSSSSIVGGGTRIRPTGYSNISTQSRIIGNSGRNEQTLTDRERQTFDVSNLLIEDLGKAEEIIMEMEAAIDEYGLVTVRDFYAAIGQSSNGFTDVKFGWDALTFEGACPKRVRGGWILDIPAPVGIK